MIRLSKYWQHHLRKETAELSELKPGRTFEASNGLMCDECCHGDRCDDPSHRLRPECPSCLGSGTNASCFDEQGNRIKPHTNE